MIKYFKNKLTKHSKKGLNLESISQKEKEKILKRADELMENIFVFDKNLDMEKCLVPFKLDNLNDWNVVNNNDEEWCFMLNRLEYINYLIAAASLRNNEKYLLKAKEFIFSWINAHKVIKKELSTRTLDLAINIDAMMQAMIHIFHLLNDEEIKTFQNHAFNVMDFLYSNYLNKYTLSNWGSIQTCVILKILVMIDENFIKNPIYLWAKKELNTQLEIQIYDDGIFWEHSTLYQLEVLNHLLKLIYFKRFENFKENKLMNKKAYLLAKTISLQTNHFNETLAFGDSDVINVSSILTKVAYIFKNPYFKAKGFNSLDFESIYILGSCAIKAYEKLEKKEKKSYILKAHDSGFYCINENNNLTLFANTSMGSGHGHCDNLHISLNFNKVPFLVDCGRYTYVENEDRKYLKSMKAHNSIIVDNDPACVPSSSWDMEKFFNVGKNYFKRIKNITCIQGYVYNTKYLQIRTLVVIDKGIWFILDKVLYSGKHNLSNYFNLHPNIILNGNFLISNNEKLKYYTNCDYKIKKGKYSSEYNLIQDNLQIVTFKEFNDLALSINCFLNPNFNIKNIPIFQDDKEILNEEFAFAKEIKISDDESYILIFVNQEIYSGRKILYCDNFPLHAKVSVIHKVKDVKRLYRLMV